MPHQRLNVYYCYLCNRKHIDFSFHLLCYRKRLEFSSHHLNSFYSTSPDINDPNNIQPNHRILSGGFTAFFIQLSPRELSSRYSSFKL
ncbi:hypothetical protein BGZ95_007136 [Linnemannia exigua]|uniref:Uncharacterized protein n=1 Tax=Linnemannia exigua TaxID=604196 RepID=A0AAD4DHK6_9FUNG|nr:hypothetical protein BGZ95_007136 [Linnemannia exigua]